MLGVLGGSVFMTQFSTLETSKDNLKFRLFIRSESVEANKVVQSACVGEINQVSSSEDAILYARS